MTGRAKGNLPAEYSSFVGRASEVAEGLAALSESRLLTVTGPGGVGKSRLAARIARQSRRRFPGGLWYAELSSVTGERALVGQVAGALGRPEVSTSEGRHLGVEAQLGQRERRPAEVGVLGGRVLD
ncbi:AAA family ATPase, partial [Nonomuraea sp. NPDC005983]|uniref:AAA family ATPase n=1 Tax=Nonomuraea sp. NPDC005983 TaxID=3155595 RepID=UPI0033B7BB55